MTIPTDGYWSDALKAAARKGWSQYGEEGVIARLLADLGTTNRYLVDIGAGDGATLSNTKALLDAGWRGARFDIAAAGDVRQERVTAENICDLCARDNAPAEPDLLSLDIDGVDWYVLRALLRGGYRPRAMCVEVNPCLPAEPAVVVAYDPVFRFTDCDYFGGSLAAYRALAAAYGYACVYVHMSINAFLVPRELLPIGAKLSIEFTRRASWPRDPRGRPWHVIGPEDLP